MKKIVLLLTLNTLLLLANPIETFTTWLGKGYTEFRIHPRIDKAYALVKQGKESEAQKLLEKVIEIDSKNSQAKEMLLELCLKKKDEVCVNKYLPEIKSKNSSVGYLFLDKAKESKKYGDYKKVSKFVQKAMNYSLKKEDKIYAQELLFDSYLKQKKYLEADKLIERNKLSISKLFNWSKLSSNLNENDYAYALASELPNKKEEYLKWKRDLLLAKKNYKEASIFVKKLYKLDPNKKRLEELIYLYKITKQDKKMRKIYKKKLLKRCDSYALLYLFEYYKESPTKKLKLLDKNYPFSCLKKSHQVVLSQELVHLLKSKNPKRAKHIANKISKHLKSNKERLVLFQESGQRGKMRDIYLQRLEHGCNKEALTFLLMYEKRNPNGQRVLLDRAYPYACFSPKKRAELTMQLVMLSKKSEPVEIEDLLDGLKINSLDKRHYISVANFYREFKRYKKSNRYLLSYLKKFPNNSKALKSLGYNYLKLNQKEMALAYFLQASKYKQEDGELLKNIGYLCLELNHPSEGIAYWKRYLKNNSDPEIILQVSKLNAKLKRPQEAMIYLSKYEKMNAKPNSEYHWLKGKLAFGQKNCKEALEHYDSLHKMKQSEVINYEYIQVLKGCNKPTKAITLLTELSQSYPNKIRYKKELAYLYKSEKDYNKAVESFKLITKKEPEKFAGYVELASLEKKRGASKKVISEAYKMALDNANDIPEKKRKYLKREIAMNSKSFHVYASEVGRFDSDKGKGAFAPVPNALYDGFGFIELSFQPHFLSKKITLFANVIHDQHNLKKSLQPSIGVRYKPLKDKELYLSAQQMIKGGSGTRNETLLRASLGISGRPVEDEDIYTNLYLDTNYFVKNRSKVLYGNYELGKEYHLSDHTTISPYVTTGASLTTDNVQKGALTNLDVGIGVAFRNQSGETRYEDALYTNQIKLEARRKYAGNSKDSNTMRIQWEFFY